MAPPATPTKPIAEMAIAKRKQEESTDDPEQLAKRFW